MWNFLACLPLSFTILSSVADHPPQSVSTCSLSIRPGSWWSKRKNQTWVQSPASAPWRNISRAVGISSVYTIHRYMNEDKLLEFKATDWEGSDLLWLQNVKITPIKSRSSAEALTTSRKLNYVEFQVLCCWKCVLTKKVAMVLQTTRKEDILPNTYTRKGCHCSSPPSNDKPT